MIEEGNTKEYALWQYLNTIKPNSDPKKVIATTDFKCVVNIGGDTLPKPSQSFIDKYITEYNKGNIITDIMVEYETIFIGLDGISKERLYRDILKVNLKDNTISIKRSKESWNRREVEQLIRHFDMTKGRDITTKEFDEWIQDNL